jgi:hypothetical protein
MYKYEAFFSYKRHSITDEWHRTTMERIQYWLAQNLGVRDAPIFFDTNSIQNGTVFAEEIEDALRASKAIISVMSPLYFTSDHCMAELNTFVEREDHVERNRGSLIACARFHDGASYPHPFSQMQSEDFAPFAIPNKAFWDSPASVSFEVKLQKFAQVVATKVRAAPPWDPGFPSPRFKPGEGAPPSPILRPVAYLQSVSP